MKSMRSALKVSLVYGYSARNAGDFAITLGAIDLLRSLGVKIKLFSRYTHENKDFYDASAELIKRYENDIEIFESPFYLDRTNGLWKTMRSYANGMLTLLGLKRKKAFREALLDSDIVVFDGGNLFRCNSAIDYTRLSALVFPLKIAQRHKRKVIIFPQSASYINKMGQRLLLPVLENASLLMLREKDSFNYMSELMPQRNFFQTIDCAFFINKNNLPSVSIPKQTIGITIRCHTVGDISFLPERQISEYLGMLGQMVEKLKASHNVIVVVQSEKDLEKSQSFADAHGLSVMKTNNVIELLSIYEKLDVLIGMRLHSIILALSVGTACFGLFCKQWGLKNPGTMKSFGMPYRYCEEDIQVDDVVEEILSLSKNRECLKRKTLQKISTEKERLIARMENVVKETITPPSNG